MRILDIFESTLPKYTTKKPHSYTSYTKPSVLHVNTRHKTLRLKNKTQNLILTCNYVTQYPQSNIIDSIRLQNKSNSGSQRTKPELRKTLRNCDRHSELSFSWIINCSLCNADIWSAADVLTRCRHAVILTCPVYGYPGPRRVLTWHLFPEVDVVIGLRCRIQEED